MSKWASTCFDWRAKRRTDSNILVNESCTRQLKFHRDLNSRKALLSIFLRELHRVARARLRHVERWLRVLLNKYHLKPKNLILAGFSQGSIIAALSAVCMGALGALVCGGVTGQPVFSASMNDYVGGGWMDWQELLPRSKRKTRFCSINGTKDPFVPRRQLEKMLAQYNTHWHWDEGVGHDFPKRWSHVCKEASFRPDVLSRLCACESSISYLFWFACHGRYSIAARWMRRLQKEGL